MCVVSLRFSLLARKLRLVVMCSLDYFHKYTAVTIFKFMHRLYETFENYYLNNINIIVSD